MRGLSGALDYCSSSKEARSFIDNYIVTIVALLMEDKSNIIASKSEHTLISWLVVVVEIVSNDLEAALLSGRVCETLPAFTEIYDDVSGYSIRSNGRDPLRIRNQFHDTNIVYNISLYLSALTELSLPFPSWGVIDKILQLVKYDASLEFSMQPALNIARAAMLQLSDEAELLKLDDDVLDILELVKGVYDNVPKQFRHSAASDFIEMHCKVILLLVSSSSGSLKMMGWSQIDTVTRECAKFKPYPYAFKVSLCIRIVLTIP